MASLPRSMASSSSSACTRPRSARSSSIAACPPSFSWTSLRANSRAARARSTCSRLISVAMVSRSGRRSSSSSRCCLRTRSISRSSISIGFGQARLSITRRGACLVRLAQFQFGHASLQSRQLELALKGCSVGTGSTAFELLLAQAQCLGRLAAGLQCGLHFAVQRPERQRQRGVLRQQAVALVAQGVDLGHRVGRIAAQGDGGRGRRTADVIAGWAPVPRSTRDASKAISRDDARRRSAPAGASGSASSRSCSARASARRSTQFVALSGPALATRRGPAADEGTTAFGRPGRTCADATPA